MPDVLRRTRNAGFLSLEAAFGAALLLFTFIGILSFYIILWEMLQAEQTASAVVRQASMMSEPAGSRRVWPVGDRMSAEAVWGSEYVQVRVAAAGGRARAERVLPREVP